jgi:integrase
MFSKDPRNQKNAQNGAGAPPQSASAPAKKQVKSSRKVTEARASAQRAKLDAQAEERQSQAEQAAKARPAAAKRERERPGSRRAATIEGAIADYLLDHAGGNHSAKTLEWHHTALGLMRSYLEEECKISLVEDIDAPELNGWLAHLRKTPGSRGKPRSERTIQTYARSARAFFHWLVRRELIARNPFDRVTFPKVGKPLIQTIDADEFERLLLACTPPHESGPIAERAAVRNRAICGCSTTRASESPSCAVSGWETLTASTACLR